MCDIPLDGAKLLFGSGGSQTVIVITPGQQVYKLFPIIVPPRRVTSQWVNRVRGEFLSELHILRTLTRDFVATNQTPHIVRAFNSYYCDQVPKTLFKNCKTYIEILLSKDKPVRPCTYIYWNKSLLRGLYVVEVEYCHSTLGHELESISQQSVRHIKEFLDRVIFQVIYTLEIIKGKYPDFVHSDLFIKNVLCQMIESNGNNVFDRYHIHGTTYDVPANGASVRINDFGLTQLSPEVHRKYTPDRQVVRDPYQDVFNFLYDLYNGGNFGGTSLSSLVRGDNEKVLFLDRYFNQFFDVSTIKTIIRNDKKGFLDADWKLTLDQAFVRAVKLRGTRDILHHFTRVFPFNNKHIIANTYGAITVPSAASNSP